MNSCKVERRLLLEGVSGEDDQSLLTQIFAEHVGTEPIPMNGLAPLLAGETIPKERVVQLFKEAQTTKAARAQELLARRRDQMREQAASKTDSEADSEATGNVGFVPARGRRS